VVPAAPESCSRSRSKRPDRLISADLRNLRALSLAFTAVLGTLPRLGEIGVCVFQHRFLIAMPKLILQCGVSRRLVIVGFYDTFRRILIGSAV
jgi:hypothetical protein